MIALSSCTFASYAMAAILQSCYKCVSCIHLINVYFNISSIWFFFLCIHFILFYFILFQPNNFTPVYFFNFWSARKNTLYLTIHCRLLKKLIFTLSSSDLKMWWAQAICVSLEPTRKWAGTNRSPKAILTRVKLVSVSRSFSLWNIFLLRTLLCQKP